MLLTLPNEVLNACLSELLPPLVSESLYGNALDKIIPVPADLCRLGQVCKVLHSLALPWIWRRVDICLGDIPHSHSRLVPGQWEYLCNHPEVAVYIRMLMLKITHSQALSLSLTAFRFVLSYIENLQILCLDLFYTHHHHAIDIIYTQLISQPRLRTLLIYRDTPPNLHPVSSNSKLPYLRHLQISACPWELHLLESTLYLESLAITYAKVPQSYEFPWMTLPIPWATLCELTIKDVENWPDAFTNFALWKKSFPTVSSPLREISIEGEQDFITTEQFHQIMVLGAQLEYLFIYGFEYIDESRLGQLAEAFPRLQELRLFMGYAREPWDAELPTIVSYLGKLKHLKRLYWNYIDGFHADDVGTTCLLAIVQVLAHGCHALEYVVFYDEDVWNSFAIQRDSGGGYAGHVEDNGRRSTTFFTSSWDSSNYNHV